jgi:hypothetical protein
VCLAVILAGMKQSPQQFSWPFNPNSPRKFSFPVFGSAEWLALAWWSECRGDTANIPDVDKIKGGTKLNWQVVWKNIYTQNSLPVSMEWISTTTNYSIKRPGAWAQTLLDTQRFWQIEINGWAMQMVSAEFQEINGQALAAWPFPSDASQCEHLCRRFHAYQQARYRWHEHLLEKHCERALGDNAPGTPNGYIPKTGAEARASLIGWLSKQRGYANSALVRDFRRQIRAKNSTLSLSEKKAFHAERAHPSGHRYRNTASPPLRPDEMGWLILTWPIWNFYHWRWPDIGRALIEKFRFGDRDFLGTSRGRLQKALRQNSSAKGSMPAEDALALFLKHLCNPTPKEKERHVDWEIRVRSHAGEKAVEKLARFAIGGRLAKQILRRPKGRGTDEKPPLWDFALQISA